MTPCHASTLLPLNFAVPVLSPCSPVNTLSRVNLSVCCHGFPASLPLNPVILSFVSPRPLSYISLSVPCQVHPCQCAMFLLSWDLYSASVMCYILPASLPASLPPSLPILPNLYSASVSLLYSPCSPVSLLVFPVGC